MDAHDGWVFVRRCDCLDGWWCWLGKALLGREQHGDFFLVGFGRLQIEVESIVNGMDLYSHLRAEYGGRLNAV